MAGIQVDGRLVRWEEIAELGWDALLVGNGLSINVSPDFAYASLFGEAEKTRTEGGLDELDRALFKRFETSNFEVVLGKLRDAVAIAEELGFDAEPYRERFASVQGALGNAVRSVHLERGEVPDSSLEAIKDELANYHAIFSTSYDLLIYWSIGFEEEYGRFCDCFWGDDRKFDPADAEIWPGNRPIYYVHGALHLIVEGSGVTRKRTQNSRTLLDQFGKPQLGDRDARPLLITEGSARDKLRAIEENDYLSHVYDTLKDCAAPMLVFGHALGEQDRHLIDAINAFPDRRVAVSMRPGPKPRVRERQADVVGKLHTEHIHFVDATTHPLGSPGLTRKEPRVRFMPWSSRGA
jgi:Domain of unknown function (DUF4917)